MHNVVIGKSKKRRDGDRRYGTKARACLEAQGKLFVRIGTEKTEWPVARPVHGKKTARRAGEFRSK